MYKNYKGECGSQFYYFCDSCIQHEFDYGLFQTLSHQKGHSIVWY